jgi:hypothetical protein
MPLSFAKLLERRSGARVVRELPYAIAPRGQEHVGGANCYSRWPRAQLGVGARRCGCSPRLGVVLRCPWPLAATVVVRRQRLSAR